MKNRVLPILLASILMTVSSASFADHGYEGEYRSYGSRIGHKLLSSLTNMTTGVLEIPKNIINTTNESNVIYGFTGGLVKGIVNTGGRIVSGVTDLVTFPLPTHAIAQPRYIWDDFDVDTSYGSVFRMDRGGYAHEEVEVANEDSAVEHIN